jgi:transposase, IS5 family
MSWPAVLDIPQSSACRLVLLLEETVAIAVTDKHVTTKELTQVIVDTTVQEKNITYPTDSKLYLKAIQKLAAAARKCDVKLRQTYVRVAKKGAMMVGRYAHAKQFKRMRRTLKKLRTWLGLVIRDLRRKVPQPDTALDDLLRLCERLHAQERTDKKRNCTACTNLMSCASAIIPIHLVDREGFTKLSPHVELKNDHEWWEV